MQIFKKKNRMKTTNTMLLSVCILYSLIGLTRCSEFHDKVFSNLLRMCPGQYVPIDNDTERMNQTSGFDSCCTDAFSNYSRLNKPEYAVHGQNCLFPRTYVGRTRYQNQRSYLMVTEPPKGGCHFQDNTKTYTGNNNNQPTCNDSDVGPFRRFLPVYSESSGLIYKNPHCASCHGQYDVTFWKTFAYCRTSTAFSYELEECDFQFAYPGDNDDLEHVECFTDSYSKCPEDITADNANIPVDIDLSFHELADACSMDNLPRFTNGVFAKNIFCYMCHYCKRSCVFPVERCSIPGMSSPGKGGATGFTRIIDPMVVSQMKVSEDVVCGLDQNKQVCHEVLCPLGQVLTFDGLEKKCKMDSIQWTASKFGIFVLLEFDHSIDVLENNLDTIFTHEETQSPWSKSWSIGILYQPFARNVDMSMIHVSQYNVSNALPVISINHVYVKLISSRSTVNPVKLLTELEEVHMKSWSLSVAGKRYRARQTLSKSVVSTITAELSPGDTRMLGIQRRHLSPDVEPCDRWLYRPFVHIRIHRNMFILNKLMLCKQVELASTYFNIVTYSNGPIVLYYNRTGQHFFDNEFTTGSRRYGEKTFRLCVSDVTLTSSESVRLRLSNELLLLATIIFSVL